MYVQLCNEKKYMIRNLFTIDTIDHVCIKHSIMSSLLMSITALGISCALVPFFPGFFWFVFVLTFSTAQPIGLSGNLTLFKTFLILLSAIHNK